MLGTTRTFAREARLAALADSDFGDDGVTSIMAGLSLAATKAAL